MDPAGEHGQAAESPEGSPAQRPPKVPARDPRGSRILRWCSGSLGGDRSATEGPRDTHRPRARRTAPGAAGAARPPGASCWPEGRGGEQGREKGAGLCVRRPGDAARFGSLPRARLPARLTPAAPVGGSSCRLCGAARCAWRWVLRSPHNLPPPTLASFKFAPALSESELINMQNHSVTH